MHHFHYKDSELFCEDVPLAEIAEQVGTPVYIYSRATLVRHFQAFDRAFSNMDHLVCFSAKANTNRAVLALFAGLGGGLDIVSGGELHRGLAAGVPPERIVYSGVGKTTAEMEYALKSGILLFNVESEEELTALDLAAGKLGVRAPVALRVNPDVDAGTHPYISTGLKKNKFGVPRELAVETYRQAHRMENIEVKGIDFHIGSQITQTGPFVEAVRNVGKLARTLLDEGMPIQYLDVGGGLGIPYRDEDPPLPEDYARAMEKDLAGLPLTLILEPGRALVGNAGVLVTRVLYNKTGAKNFIIVDAGMNDLLRPSIYQAFHAVWPVADSGRALRVADVVGPICESGDFLAKDREMPVMEPGELLSVMSAGAYGFVMSSNYNSRPRTPEVLVSGGQFAVVRARETYEDLCRGESIPDFLE